MDATLQAASELRSLRAAAPVSPFGLIARARNDADRLRTALESFGYYECVVKIEIEGRSLDDPDLAPALEGLPKGREARVDVGFEPGPQYRLRRIEVDGELPAFARGALGLSPGDPAVAATVLAAGTRLLGVLQEHGYAFARVDPPVAYQDPEAPVLDLVFHATAGAQVPIGAIHIEGLKRVHERMVRKGMKLRTGQPFSAAAVERARNDLLALGPFASVSMRLGDAVDETGGVPITIRLRERPRHAAGVNAAYSSDLGGSGGLTWTDRNVFGGAGELTFSGTALDLGGNATTAVGYDANVKLLLPNFLRADQSLQVAVDGIKQSLQAYDQTARTAGVTLSRKLSRDWSASAGFSSTDEQVLQAGVSRNYTLLAAPLSVSYDSTDLRSPLDDPTHGMRDSVSVAPTVALGHPNATFVISQIKFAAYFDAGRLFAADAGRTVVAARLLAGLAQGAGEFSLPPDQRFYGGGSGTIRGFRYQSVGPAFPPGSPSAGLPVGGTAIEAGTLELRQRLGGKWGAAAFVDGGQVSSSLQFVPNVLRIGAGAGVRYYTPIGPIRLDFAVPLKMYDSGQDRFEFYIGLGQAF